MSAGNGTPLRILLVDDHAVVREGYRRLLARDPNLEVVGEAGTSAEAIAQERALAPDVTILDIALPGISGIETLRRILAWRPGARVLMFSMYQDSIYARRAFEAGACGYVSKASAPELLVEAVRTVAAGGRYTSPDVTEAIAQQSSKAAELALSLSSREHEILRLLSRGLAPAEIGERLGISPKTVANQQWSIKQKLGATSALQLLLIARELGLN